MFLKELRLSRLSFSSSSSGARNFDNTLNRGAFKVSYLLNLAVGFTVSAPSAYLCAFGSLPFITRLVVSKGGRTE